MPKSCEHGSYLSRCKPCRATYMRLWTRRHGLVRGLPPGPAPTDCPHGTIGIRRCATCKRERRRELRRRRPLEWRRAERLRWRNYAMDSARSRRYGAQKRAFIGWLKDQPCADCSGRFPSCCMDFDHREPNRKHFVISKVTSLARLQDEVMGCDVVCANCHRIRTLRLLKRGPQRGDQSS